ncbi:TPA: histidine-type phosphatase [Legionella pneumophila]|nr:histidine-type phosphatase [Legionella pneumophila]HBC1991817.1 histidine-type phosphatase [Legionella pneumophila]
MVNKICLSFALLISAPSILLAEDKLIFAVDIIRHGDRTPVIALSTVNYQWQEGLGQLTADGMQQEYKMGVTFRKKYIEESHLLPEHYEYGTIYVRSTDYARTLMSAQSLLMGLYPPGTGPTIPSGTSALPYAFQPVPVFSAPSKCDDVIIQQVDRKEREKLMEQYVFSTREWQQKNNELKDKYPLWSRLTGVRIDNLEDLEIVGDTLHVHQVHNAPMPEGLSPNDIDTIIDASEWAFMAQEKPQQIASVYSSKLMANIANYLNSGSLQKSKLKYVLLSAHDTTIASVLSFLGSPLEKAPPYASNVNFSLYDNGANYYTVKITYNGNPVPIPACGGSVCELQQLINLVNDSKNSV